MKKDITLFMLASALFAGLAWPAGTPVLANQGAPGNQGPWPVTVVSGGSDGGAVVVQNSFCLGSSPNSNTVVGVAAGNVPAAAAANRLYLEICNSLQNTGSPIVKCRTDGVTPVAAAGNAGDVLGIGDCIRYQIPATTVPSCISDTAGTNATSFECVVH